MVEPTSAPPNAQAPPAAANWRDLGAGLCVAGLLIPEAVAYAGLAHLPAVHGLTAAMVGLAIYGVFGGSRFAIVAPTSSTATLAAAAALSMSGASGTPASADFAQALLALVLLAGIALALLAWARQGQLSAFVSRPVLRGFAFALAITIVIKQLPDALGLELPKGMGSDPLHVLVYAAATVPRWHGASMAVALLAALGIAGLRRWPLLPASMLVMAAAIVAAYALDLQSFGVQLVGAIDRPSLRPGWPALGADEWLRAGELAVGLVVLVFAESWGSVRTLALAHGETLDANRELLVLGACNVSAALLQGMAVGAGFSASSANAAAGATSRRAGLAALLVIVLALAFALPALRLLPRPVLAVAVVAALWHALSPQPLIAVWRMNRDRLLIACAVAAVLVLGVLDGMLASIALSLAMALRRFSEPVVHELGELDNTRNYVALDAHEGAVLVAGLMILRPEEPLFFANAERVAAAVRDLACGRAALHTVVLSLEESVDLDATAVECLLELAQRLAAAGQRLVLARVKDEVRELLARVDPNGLGAPERLFWSVADAARA